MPMLKPRLSMIVAAAENNVIGKNNGMPWHIPEDFRYFKEKTHGKPCIMGRKTFESILSQLGKPLPKRPSIILSNSGYSHEGAETVDTIKDAIEKAAAFETEEIMIIGGANIYAQFMDRADRIYLTRIHMSPEGDARFPDIDRSLWQETARDERDEFSFLVYDRL